MDYASDLSRFIESKELEKVVLIGHSMYESFSRFLLPLVSPELATRESSESLTKDPPPGGGTRSISSFPRGGKVAMALSLAAPSLLSKLVSVDMSPAVGAISDEFAKYIDAMKEVEEKGCKDKKEADKVLEKYEPVPVLHSRPLPPSRGIPVLLTLLPRATREPPRKSPSQSDSSS